MSISKKIFLLSALFLSVGFISCKDWGEMDLPAGNQQKPNLTTLATYTFDGFDANVQAGAYEGGKSPKLVTDPQLEVVLELDGGYLQYPNPVQHVSLQEGMAITGWVKLNKEDNEGAIFSFGDDTDKLVFTGDCSLYYKDKKLTTVSQTLTAGEWHWLAVQVMNSGIIINVDGMPVGTTAEPTPEEARATEAPEDKASIEVLDFLTTTASGFYFGYGSEIVPTKRWMKQFTVYKNTITENEIAKPELPEIGGGSEITLPEPVYFNDFEGDNAGCTIKGDGKFEDVGDVWGKVFQNGGGAICSHYLLLPEDVLTHSDRTKELTISFWINAKNAGDLSAYMWAPIFSAHSQTPVNPGAGNMSFPLFTCEFRGRLYLNIAGEAGLNDGQNYCDFLGTNAVGGFAKQYNGQADAGAGFVAADDWLADDAWHYYTVTISETGAIIYFDGEVANEWVLEKGVTGKNTGKLFENSGLTYVALGGNQCLGWTDNDAAFMFDDIAIYDKVLTPEQIAEIISTKKGDVPTE